MRLNKNTRFWLSHQTAGYVQRNLDMTKLVRFDMGENTFILNSWIKSALQKIKEKDIQEYPDPNCKKLKEAVAKSLRIKPGMLTLGSGLDEFIETLPRLVVNPDDKVIVITPTFFRFIDSSRRLRTKIIEIRTSQKDNFQISQTIVARIISMANRSNVKLIWLCSPNNPTGQIIKPLLIEKIIQKTKAFVVLDQAFNQINSKHGFDSELKLAIKNRNAIVLQSLSKMWGLAGLRVGWAVGHPETIKILEKFRLPFNISSASQQLSIAALSDKSHLDKVNKFVVRERLFIESELRKLPNLDLCSGSKTLFFLLRHKSKDLFEELLKHNILTADFRNANGLERMGFIRITLRTRKENEFLLKVLKQIN